MTARPCNGVRSWIEWVRCDLLLVLLGAIYVLTAHLNPFVGDSIPSRLAVSIVGVLIAGRRMLPASLQLSRYHLQMAGALTAYAIGAVLLVGSARTGLAWSHALAWWTVAVLQTDLLRRHP